MSRDKHTQSKVSFREGFSDSESDLDILSRLEPAPFPSESPSEEMRQLLTTIIVTPVEYDYHQLAQILHESDFFRFDIKWAKDFQTAHSLLSSNEYELVFVNESLEQRSGIELVRDSRMLFSETAFILMSHNVSEHLESSAIGAGASDLLDLSNLETTMLHRSIRFAVNRKRTNSRIMELSRRDYLTGLFNRSSFDDQLDHSLKRAERNNLNIGLLYIDIDGFKEVNDSLGHDYGDDLLKVISERLLESIREVDTAARLGGDEFAIILESLVNHEDGAVVASRINNSLNAPIFIKGKEINISSSIGIAVYPIDARINHELLLSADKAMYIAKSQGGNTFVFASKDKNAKTANKFALEHRLKQAMSKRELFVVYQPRINIIKGRVLGATALPCWNHPNRGFVKTQDFISLLEDSDISIDMGLYTLDKACRQCRIWQNTGIGSFTLDIAIQRKCFLSDKLIDAIPDLIATSHLKPSDITLCIQENVLNAERRAEKQISTLRSIGINIGIINVDTGKLSIERISKYAFKVIKIDQSMVKNSIYNKISASTIRAIVAISNEFGIKTVAECSGDTQEIETLLGFGCNTIQIPIEKITYNIKGLELFRDKAREQDIELKADLPKPV